ncbi:hypothetical protein Emed_004863 [Eimeria media]
MGGSDSGAPSTACEVPRHLNEVPVHQSELPIHLSEVPIHLSEDSDTERAAAQLNAELKSPDDLPLVDGRLQQVGLELQRIEEQILAAVRQQAGKQQQQQQQQQQQIAGRVQELLNLSAAAQQVAAASDEEAAALCADIRMLSVAKDNLTRSVAVLRQLLMLAAAVDQLREAALYRQYKEAAMLLLALEPLARAFEVYRHVPRVAALLQQHQQLREGLQQQLLEDFENAVDASSNSSSSNSSSSSYWRERLTDAGLCVDSLNIRGFREQLIGAISGCLLAPYLTTFASGPPAAAAAATAAGETAAAAAAGAFFERRFAWYRRTLRDFDLHLGKLLPCHWLFSEAFTQHFCRVTKQQLQDFLAFAQHVLTPQQLLSLLREARAFEERLISRFAAQRTEVLLLLPAESPYEQQQQQQQQQHTRQQQELLRAAALKTAATIEEQQQQQQQDGRPAASLASRVEAVLQQEARGAAAAGAAVGGGAVGTGSSGAADLPAAAAAAAAAAGETAQLPPPVCFLGAISSGFEGFMGGWLAQEEEKLQHKLSLALQQETMIFNYAVSALACTSSSSSSSSNSSSSRNPFEADLVPGAAAGSPAAAAAAAASAAAAAAAAAGEEGEVCQYSSASQVFSACKCLFESTVSFSKQQTLADVVAAFKRLFTRYFGILQNR